MKNEISRKLVTVLLVCSSFIAKAYVSHVVVKDASGKKQTDLEVLAVTPQGQLISQSEFQKNDSTYLLRELPDPPFIVLAVVEDATYGEGVTEPKEEITIEIPVREKIVKLDEVVVEQDRRMITDDRTVYIPTRKQKSSAHDGNGLLANLGISQLNVNPVTSSVTTASGENVSFFIDYVPATQEQIDNINTDDVRKVEIFESPSDPVFRGSRHVVNFLMKKYEYGGSAKLDATQKFVTPSTRYGISSLFAIKDMSYDVGFNGGYDRMSHNSDCSVSQYAFPNETVIWEEVGYPSNRSRFTEMAYFRAIYNKDKITVSNTVGLQVRDLPIAEREITTQFSSSLYPSGSVDNVDKTSGLSPYWIGNYYFILPSGFTLTVDPGFAYSHNTTSYSYGNDGNRIINDAAENTYNLSLSMNLSKTLGRNRLGISLFGQTERFKVTYSGTTPAVVRSSENVLTAVAEYSLSLKRLAAYASAGINVLRSSFTDSRYTEADLRYFLSLSYMVGKKSRLGLSAQFTQLTTPMSQMSPTLQFINSIEARCGNPDLKPTGWYNNRLYCSFIPSDNFSVSAFAVFERYSRSAAKIYLPLEGTYPQMIVSTNVNSGFRNIWQLGVSPVVSFFRDKLSLGGNVSYNMMRRHGINSMNDNWFTFNVYANLYVGNFYIQPYYSHSTRSSNSVSMSRYPSSYQIAVGWNKAGLNISAIASNIFRSDWLTSTVYSFSENYSTTRNIFGNASHRAFAIRISYSFSYGKKLSVNPGEAKTKTTSSGILE